MTLSVRLMSQTLRMAATTDKAEGTSRVKLSESFMLTENAISKRPEARMTNQAEVVLVRVSMGKGGGAQNAGTLSVHARYVQWTPCGEGQN
ncbi:hypothetical protein GCM10025771_13590 [Niveibacterium umoris]